MMLPSILDVIKLTQFTANFKAVKSNNFQLINCDTFLIPAQNIDCWY